ncbi:MAG: type IV pili methyl-accepting chemotaxis transducer N-terminal domain-containing protein [Burkholderiales bacterium]|nr:type IV pili methyl-accepting chemotaxis transducer N-terminal domain-containing protein [Burkholderiales bacterium]
MSFRQGKLSTKLVGVALSLLLVGFVAIGFTLLASWKLEGGAAAINDMGSERMRAYRIAFLLTETLHDPARSGTARGALEREIQAFEGVLIALMRGDPARPLLLPRVPAIAAEADAVLAEWKNTIRPRIEAALLAAEAAGGRERASALHLGIEPFVQRIDHLVRAIEQDNTRNAEYLRYMQFGLVLLAMTGTVALIYLMFLLVVRPVNRLQESMQRIANGELTTRLPVETNDEFGELARGFNRMASRLHELYNSLEERVAIKTRSLAEKNRDLHTLYEVSALLNEPGSTEQLCRGFLRKLIAVLEAQAGSVRLIDPRSRLLHMYVQEALPAAFAEQEQCLGMGECVCGDVAQAGAYAVRTFASDAAIDTRCARAGYRTVAAFTVHFQGQSLGIFNLYYREPREIPAHERQLLETLGQDLGAAIEHLRLVSRDKELAISEERNLLAQDLHDSIAQSLAYLNLQAQMLEDSLGRRDIDEARATLAQIRVGVQESYDTVRELLVHFRTRVSQGDIEFAISDALERFHKHTGIRTSCEVSGSGVPLSAEQQVQVLHIVQEALSNVRKHSGATQVRLQMQRDRSYVFRVADNGRGFDAERAQDGAGRQVGLRIMRERAQRIGAQVRIDSRTGQGSEVTLTLPVTKEAA